MQKCNLHSLLGVCGFDFVCCLSPCTTEGRHTSTYLTDCVRPVPPLALGLRSVCWCFFDGHPPCIKGNAARDHLSSSVHVAVLAKPSRLETQRGCSSNSAAMWIFQGHGQKKTKKSSVFNLMCIKSSQSWYPSDGLRPDWINRGSIEACGGMSHALIHASQW